MPKKTKVKKAVVAKKKTSTKAKPQKLTAVKTPFTKSQLLQYIAENTDLSKNKIADVFELLNSAINAHLCKNGAGTFTLVGIAKFKIKRMPAQKARKGRNPFTGEEVMFKAKPARNVVKIRPLQKLKNNVA
jgi:nucleoid DNA-binding protein